MITALFFYNAKGDVIMSKFYKEGVKRNVSDVFRIQIITAAGKAPVAGNRSLLESRLPVLTLGSTSFLYIRSGLLWVVAVTRSNQDSLLIFEFLCNLVNLLKRLFTKGADSLSEDDVVGNFVTIFDLLDEVVEFGYPTNMEHAFLASTVPGVAGLKLTPGDKEGGLAKKLGQSDRKDMKFSTDHAYDPTKVSWREQGIKYRKNEIFLNVDEKITLLLDSRGNRLRSSIDGAITMKSHLSGMPVCRFGFASDDFSDLSFITLDDFKFHKCVDLAKHDTERVIRFVPPDGTFQLMSYHINDSFPLPFDVVPSISQDGTHAMMKIRVHANYSSKVSAGNVALNVVVPQGAHWSGLSCSNGKAKFDPTENKVVWKFSKFYGQLEHLLSVEFDVQETSHGWFKPLITLDFTMDTYSASGLQVKFLKVLEKSNYRTIKWVKYSTHAGSYEIRF